MTETAATRTASDWLDLLDTGTWQESWATTGQFFRSRNTVAGGQAASEQARVPLGCMLPRQLLSEAGAQGLPHDPLPHRFRKKARHDRDYVARP